MSMNNELERMYEETITTYFNSLKRLGIVLCTHNIKIPYTGMLNSQTLKSNFIL
jgi:hypothetical protein